MYWTFKGHSFHVVLTVWVWASCSAHPYLRDHDLLTIRLQSDLNPTHALLINQLILLYPIHSILCKSETDLFTYG